MHKKLKAVNGRGFDHTVVTTEGELELIATVHNWTDESIKWAYLFAAAPELYEAVCAASEFLYDHKGEIAGEELLQKLREAEAAAKGAVIGGVHANRKERKAK